MEKEGLVRALQVMEANGVVVDTVVSDRHLQVQKLLRDHNITNNFDIWHVAKGMIMIYDCCCCRSVFGILIIRCACTVQVNLFATRSKFLQ